MRYWLARSGADSVVAHANARLFNPPYLRLGIYVAGVTYLPGLVMLKAPACPTHLTEPDRAAP